VLRRLLVASTAAELIRAGGCSPQCLVSAGVRVQHCDCACNGAYHGALSDADIASAVRHRDARLQVVTTRAAS
jgi:hypothetical protein